MISLSKHIEILLLEHDCVIIPGLGGFIANQEPARIDDNDAHNFLPPYRTIGFNSDLTVNDGLLVQSYMQAYDAAYPEAYLQMEKEINEMIAQLDINGTYSFHGVGTLTKNMDASLSFNAMESGILTPSLYGLYSIEIKSLEEAKKEKEIKRALSQTSVLPIQTETDLATAAENGKDSDAEETISSKDSNKEKEIKNSKVKEYATKIIKFRPNWKEISVASAVAVIMFFLFHFPSLKSEEELNDTVVASSIFVGNPSELGAVSPTAKHEKTIATKPASYKPVTHTITNNKATVSSSSTTSKTTTNTSTTKSVTTDNSINNKEYTIVLASCVTEKNAKIFIESYEKEGFKEARYVVGKINRVLYSGFSSNEEATESLTKLRSQSPLFKDAWILHEKK